MTLTPLTQGTLVSIDEGVASAMRAYTAADVQLRRELERLLADVILDPSSTRRFRAQQTAALLTRIRQAQAELRGVATVFAEDSLARVYASGMSRADRILGAGREAIGAPSFTLVHRQALEVLALDAFDDLVAATDYVDTAARRAIREATKLRTSTAVVTGESVDQSRRALVRDLARRGVGGFVDVTGRSWRIGSYAEMVIRTKSAHAYNTGTILRTEQEGTTALEILDGRPSGHEACERYNGSTCDTAWAIANPIEHPNCVRSFGPLPLFRGTPTHTAGGTAANLVADARANRTNTAGLTVRAPT